MKTLKFILPFIVLLSIFGCEKKVDELQFEKDVLNNVFVEIVDSIYMDRRTMYPPPSPRIIDFKTNKRDTVGYHDRLKEYWHFQDSIKNDKHRILIAVSDFKTSNEIIEKKIDLTPFKKNQKFDFQYASNFPDQISWDPNDLKSPLPVGTISVSKIRFNETKTIGYLSANASCGGGKCGQGFSITIEKKGKNWRITKIEGTWIS